jgi:hypothetical protein
MKITLSHISARPELKAIQAFLEWQRCGAEPVMDFFNGSTDYTTRKHIFTALGTRVPGVLVEISSKGRETDQVVGFDNLIKYWHKEGLWLL